MKELHSYATNTLALVRDGKIEPHAEIALVLWEVEYLISEKEGVVRDRVLSMIRFAASPAALRTLAAKLIITAGQVESELTEAMGNIDAAKEKTP
jgi:hypothetical protein